MLIEKDSVRVSHTRDVCRDCTIFSLSLADSLMRDLASEAPSLIMNKIVEEQAKYIAENFQKEIMESIDFKAIGDEVVHKLADDFIKKFKESCIKETEAKVTEVMEEKALDEIEKLSTQNKIMQEALIKLSKLGNGENLGNSVGNAIAQDALAKALYEKEEDK